MASTRWRACTTSPYPGTDTVDREYVERGIGCVFHGRGADEL
jgi:hypothetical protein